MTFEFKMSAMGQKQTLRRARVMSVLVLKADIKRIFAAGANRLTRPPVVLLGEQ